MADTKTAEQWREASSNSRQKLDTLNSQFANIDGLISGADKTVQDANALVLRAESDLRVAIRRGDSARDIAADTRRVAEAKAERDSAEAARNKLVDYKGQYETRVAELNADIENSDRQADIAQNSPPGTRANPETMANPPPANQEPGNNTDASAVTFDEPTQAIIPQQVDANGVVSAAGDTVVDGVADVGELGINTDLPTDAALGELGINTTPGVQNARSSGNEGRITPFPQAYDYRVRISLADSADYLYKDPSLKQEDLLYPLAQTNGVIYPYTPTISVTYTANYQSTDLTHSNYRGYNYTGSNIDQFQITGDFTAQDVVEANYVLAVIHFFRSVTKMFYGQDQNRGVPPPLVYITGHGEYGFDKHPLAITNFTLSYPTDVDYINAGPSYNVANVLNPYKGPILSYSPPGLRLSSAKLNPGGLQSPPVFGLKTNTRNNVTRVPTKLQIQLSAIPIVTRNTISNIFSLKDYATGNLLRGSKNKSGGGVW